MRQQITQGSISDRRPGSARTRLQSPTALDAGERDGPDDPALVERAAIVAWLREYDSRQPGFHNMRVTRNVANDIERGKHLRGDDE